MNFIRLMVVTIILGSFGASAADLKSILPSGWSILDSATGDLNGDNLSDAALVIESNDSLEGGSFGERVKYYHNRSLIILFGKAERKYESFLVNDTFIPLDEDPCMEEPYHDIEIKNGALHFIFGVFMNAGGWSTSSFHYIFRFQKGDFYLIGQDINTFARNTMEYTNISINYSTQKMCREEGNETEERHPKVVWSKTSSAPLVKLRDMSDWQYTPPGVSY